MNLAIVDIDGTLTDTNGIDSECYVRVVSSVLGHPFSNDWSTYANVTDSGIAEELWQTHLGRLPSDGEIASLESAFVEELERAWSQQPAAFAPIAGAREFLEKSGDGGWTVALATGAWARSAQLKLKAAGLPTDLPLASGNDSPRRIDIVRRAIEAAVLSNHDRVVLVGDGIWDLNAARELGFPFVGIASGDHAQLLRSSGATHVFSDFSSLNSFLAALASAGVP